MFGGYWIVCIKCNSYICISSRVKIQTICQAGEKTKENTDHKVNVGSTVIKSGVQ